MRTKCHSCLCRTCLTVCCDRKNCTGKKESCENYKGFRQRSIFEQEEKQRYQSVPRHPLSYYGLTDERVDELRKLVQSGKYASLASQAAYMADETIAEYILLSITKSLSFEGLDKLYGRREIERMPCSRTGFYCAKRYFWSLFDKGLRRMGK